MADAGSPDGNPCGSEAPVSSTGKTRGPGGLRKQAKETGASVWPGGELGHVADTLGEGDGGGPAPQQGQKPLRRLPARVVAVEGEEDAGAAPKGGGQRPGCPGQRPPEGPIR